ncbi:unnamed protein product, partial [marine sediment metagenome]
MKTTSIKVDLSKKVQDRSYNIIVDQNILGKLGMVVKTLNIGKSIFILTDSNVGKLYAKQVIKSFENAGFEDIGKFEIKPGEQSKTLFPLSNGRYLLSTDTIYYFALRHRNELIAYAIAKIRTKNKEDIKIIEMGSCRGDTKLMIPVIEAIVSMGYQLGHKTVSINTTRHSIYYQLLKKTGFNYNFKNRMVVSGMALDLKYMARRCWLPNPSTTNLCLQVITPYN